MAVILASQSPRRRELLGLLKLPFTVCVADIDETMDPKKAAFDEVARLSLEKALAIPRKPDDVVIAADTIVVLDAQVLGKPRDAQDAERMLKALSGRTHQVMTGLAVVRGEEQEVVTEVTTVHFRPLSDEEIHRYIESGEPMDKAGSYGIQGGAAAFVSRIEGDYFNVVGLPVCRLAQILTGKGVLK